MSWRLEERDLDGQWRFSEEELLELDELLKVGNRSFNSGVIQRNINHAAQSWLASGGAQGSLCLPERIRRLSLSPRLKIVAAHHPEGWGLVDLGTDHASLPIELCKRGHSPLAAGIDLARPPLLSAENRLVRSRQMGKVALLMGDGISPLLSPTSPATVIQPWDEESRRRWDELKRGGEVTVSICGLGGEVARSLIRTLPPWVSVVLVQANDQPHLVDEALKQRVTDLSQSTRKNYEAIDEAVIERERLFVTKISRPAKEENLRYADHHEPLWNWVWLSRLIRRLAKTPPAHKSRIDKCHLVNKALDRWIRIDT